MLVHLLQGNFFNGESEVKRSINERAALENVDRKYYESNFCIKFIGAAGCVELETIRFFKRFCPELLECGGKDVYYPKIFNWVN